MRGLTGVLSVVAVGMLATGSVAQERADFSGAWGSQPVPASRGGPEGQTPQPCRGRMAC